MKNKRLIVAIGCIIVAVALILAFVTQPLLFKEKGETVRNIILMIGDGMGIGQITVAQYSLGLDHHLNLTLFPYMGLVTTHSLNNLVTDSAAAGTAIATGNKTANSFISMTPNGKNLTTVLEYAEERGRATGIVTTARLTDATPAAFATHVMSRYQEDKIAAQMLNKGIEVLLGGGRSKLAGFLNDAKNKGYVIVQDRTQLLSVGDVEKILGIFSEDDMNYNRERDPAVEPSLAEMVNTSIRILSKNTKGFFLMVEGALIDHACHANDISDTIGEVLAFDAAVGVALQFAKENGETLVIVTADHETGGLAIDSTTVYKSKILDLKVKWATESHSGNMVPVFAFGPRADYVVTMHDNTDIAKFIFELLEEENSQIETMSIAIGFFIINSLLFTVTIVTVRLKPKRLSS